MTWDKKLKEKIQYGTGIFTILFGMTLTAIGCFLSPVGEVDGSLITVFGVCLTFGGAIFGINTHYSNELNSFKTEIRKQINEENEDSGNS